MQQFPLIKQPAEAHTTGSIPWRRWLLAFDAYNLSTNTLFTGAIWVIYLAAHGYSPLAIGLFEMLFHIAKFVMEVPTGIFADLLGRRKSLIVFCAIQALEILLFLVPTVPSLMLSFALSGAAFAFRGGANEAILWSIAGYAEPNKQSARYSRLVSRMFLVGLIGEIIGTATGGYLGHILEVLPFICRAMIVALGILPLLLIPEKSIQHMEPHTRTNPFTHLGKGLHAVWQSPTLLGLLLISGLTESCWQTIYFYYQLYLHGLGFSLSAIGIVVAISMVSNFIFTASAPFVMRVLPERWLVPTFVLTQIVGLALMSMPQSLISLFGYIVLFQAALAILSPAVSTYINERSPEQQRATVLSFQTGLFSAAMIVLFPLFGLGISHASYSTIYLWTLLALAIGSVVIWGLTQLRKQRHARRAA